MFCIKCAEAIPDNSEICPICGANQKEVVAEQTVVYASQKEAVNVSENKKTTKTPFIALICLAAASFVFMALNYMSVSIKLLYYGSSDSDYTGYYLMQCLEGTAALSGWMVISLILLNIITIAMSIFAIIEKVIKKPILKTIMFIESFLYLAVTIIPFFHMSSLLQEFDSKYTTSSIGIGCYLNIGIAIAICVVFFASGIKKLSDK